MFFTQEDYRKIEQWLYQRTVKDTELPYADPINNTDKIPIIQNGKNKILNLNDFVKQVADMKLPDFYNVTANEKKSCLCLKEAIELVPVKQRKLGLTITFRNRKRNWVIFQFMGASLNQWSVIDCWDNIIDLAIKEALVYPDEEDITGIVEDGRTVLKFKDREYNPDEFSGKGLVILRKNTTIIDVNNEDVAINCLTQEMINKDNTIYIIQYDFDLNNKAIKIPSNSVLYFNGGTLNNGAISLDNTYLYGVFSTNDIGTNISVGGKPAIGQILYRLGGSNNPTSRSLQWFDGSTWKEFVDKRELSTTIEALTTRVANLEKTIK